MLVLLAVFPIEPRVVSMFNAQTQRVLGTVVGDTSPNHNSNSYYREPTFYHIGTLDPLPNKADLVHPASAWSGASP